MDLPKCAGTEPIAVELEEGKKYAWWQLWTFREPAIL